MNRILAAAAVLPALALIIYVCKADKLEKEPVGLIAKLVLLGVLSTFMALVTETVGELILNMLAIRSQTLYSFLTFFLVVGLSEEGFKYLLLKKLTWKNENFNCRFDGIVYSVCLSLGFALWENLSYVANYGISVAVARALTAVPGHASFGVIMGAFYSTAKGFSLMGDEEKSKRCRNAALIVPTLVHGLYDFVASAQTYLSTLVFLALIAAVFIVSFKILKKMSKNDGYFITDYTDTML